MIILVLNCGSSSLKYQLLDMRSAEDYTLMKKGLVERIGDVVPDHAAGIKMVLDALVSPEEGVIDSLERIDAVGHRVAHGGEFFDRSVRVGQVRFEVVGAGRESAGGREECGCCQKNGVFHEAILS